MKTLLFVGHPGHELLAHKFISIYKPDVIFLTDGSGNDGQPRIDQSLNLIKSLGLNAYFPFEPYSDRQIYDLILSNSIDSFLRSKSVLKEFILEQKYRVIVGDALEGFNPSHDLCRYLINSIVIEMEKENKVKIENYDFFQDDVRKNQTSDKKTGDIILELNEDELQKKMDACINYPKIKSEVDKFVSNFGKDFFALEFFRKINDPTKIVGWDTDFPYYEEFGRKRIAEGTYKQLISFDTHMMKLAQALSLDKNF